MTHLRSCPLALGALVALGFALASGCATFELRTPPGFAQLADQAPRFEYRAVTAFGVALSVRVAGNDEHANLDFWAEALDRALQSRTGYHASGARPVQSADGVPGRRMAYAVGDPQTGSLYWVTVFVTRRRVFVVEAGGGVDAFARARVAIESALQSFRTL